MQALVLNFELAAKAQKTIQQRVVKNL